MRRRHAMRSLLISAVVVAVLSACDADTPGPDQTSVTSPTPPPTALTSTPAVRSASAAPRTQKWVDLQVGECLADLPPSDPSVVTVSIVDCAAAHQAEVYCRAPVGVNAATADVANERCAAGFSHYTGQALDDGPFAVTYLIDSNQDRTSDNPDASTVICLLHAADGGALTGSAHR